MADIAVGFIGRMALEAQWVTPEQVHECVNVQLECETAGKPAPRLGELLVARGYLTEARLNELLTLQKTRKQPSTAIREHRYAQGDVIIREGDASNHDLYILLEGTVEETRAGRVLHRHGTAGEFLGELSTLLKTPRPTTMTAATACRLYHVPETQVEDFFRRKPALALRLAEILASRMYAVLMNHVAAGDTPVVAQKPPATRSDSNIVSITTDEIAAIQHATGRKEPTPQPRLAETMEMAAPPVQHATPPAAAPARPAPVPEPEAVIQDLPGEDLLADEPSGEFCDVLSLAAPEVEFVSIDDDPRLADAVEEEAPVLEADDTAGDVSVPTLPPPTVAVPRAQCIRSAAGVPVKERVLQLLSEAADAPVSNDVVAAVNTRLDTLMLLEEVSQARLALERVEDCPDDVRSELSRQRREMEKIPPYEALYKSLDKLRTKLGDTTRPTEPRMREALELAQRQKEILIWRAQSLADHLRVCASTAVWEPLYGIFSDRDADAAPLFGWAVYVVILEGLRNALTDRREKVQMLQRKKEEARKAGFLSRFRKKDGEEADPEMEAIEAELRALSGRESCIAWALRTAEPPMVEAFWDYYGRAANLLLADPDPVDTAFLRAFLRWGLLGCSRLFIDTAAAQALLADATRGCTQPEFSGAKSLILYADEAIELTARGVIPQSPNEELELNARNSPAWKADRAWRRIRHGRIRRKLMEEVAERLKTEIGEGTLRRDEAEARLAAIAHDRVQKVKIAACKQEAQSLRVELGRKTRLLERVLEVLMPRLDDDCRTAEEALAESGVTITPESLARHEVTMTRRMARLAAKLKEPFLPFTLRDLTRGGELGNLNTRGVVAGLLVDAEKRDPMIFREPLVTVNKRVNRTLVRYAPVVALTPGGGIMGFLVVPRNGIENGRVVLPGYVPRGISREDILWTVLSDFRYDTSKASAGVDIMNSDTLVARYAEVRWNLRKKDREVRQKAGIYTEENERTNWRRHYALYMKSAFDNGKLLFYKCPDLYELVIDKFVELPAGCELLKRG